jgi:hypothetical protein
MNVCASTKRGEKDLRIIFGTFSHELHGSIIPQTLLFFMNEGIVLVLKMDEMNRKIISLQRK